MSQLTAFSSTSNCRVLFGGMAPTFWEPYLQNKRSIQSYSYAKHHSFIHSFVRYIRSFIHSVKLWSVLLSATDNVHLGNLIFIARLFMITVSKNGLTKCREDNLINFVGEYYRLHGLTKCQIYLSLTRCTIFLHSTSSTDCWPL